MAVPKLNTFDAGGRFRNILCCVTHRDITLNFELINAYVFENPAGTELRSLIKNTQRWLTDLVDGLLIEN